jgi:carboxylesterase type B
VTFAKSGNPDAEGMAAWSSYKPDAEQVTLFGNDMKADAQRNTPQLDFFKDR